MKMCRWKPVPLGGNGCIYGTIVSPAATSLFGIFDLRIQMILNYNRTNVFDSNLLTPSSADIPCHFL